MKQVTQNLGSGVTEVVEIPAPMPRLGSVLIRSRCSLVSPGTERMLRAFGKAGFLAKARQQPDKVRQVFDKVRTDGLIPTIEAVRAKLDQPIPLGYSNVGNVIDACGAEGLSAGDRVVSNGPHAQIVRAARNLTARVPDNVDDDTAAFTVLGAIALEGIRLADVKLGDCVTVIGLGLVGLLAVQLLRAQGARVLGIDLNSEHCMLGRSAGAETVCVSDDEDPVAAAMVFSRGRGVDSVLICAATQSNSPIVQAARMARPKGRVVLVGVTKLDLPRDEFFRKELSFQVSCSYGPGRYDAAYEAGQDYPVGHVRWTAQRNFEAVLDMMAAGKIDVGNYISHRVPIDAAAGAYAALDEDSNALGILFDYPQDDHAPLARTVVAARWDVPPRNKRLGVIGAGNYATRTLIPAFLEAGAIPVAVAGTGGIAEVHAARKFGFGRVTTVADDVASAPDVDLVVVATRHDSHASYVVKALQAGKAVFVEKPLALADQELDQIQAAYHAAASPFLMVGFNRRFSPFVEFLVQQLRQLTLPPAICMTINAGAVPADHWTQNPAIGGGRIIGEACHFIDLARNLAGAPIIRKSAQALRVHTGARDSAMLSLGFANGAIAAIQYLTNGHPSLPKERIEVFCGGKSWLLNNFRKLDSFGGKGISGGWLGSQNKGQKAMARAIISSITAGCPAPIPAEELFEVAGATIALDRQLREN